MPRSAPRAATVHCANATASRRGPERGREAPPPRAAAKSREGREVETVPLERGGARPAVAAAGAPGVRRQSGRVLPRPRRAARSALPTLRQPQDLGCRQARGRRGTGALPGPAPFAAGAA